MEDYAGRTDEELIAELRDNRDEIIDYLLEKYKSLVRKHANALYLIGGDTDDLIQEGMIGLFKAIREYQPGHEASFYHFADLCIARQMYTAVEAVSYTHLEKEGYLIENIDATVIAQKPKLRPYIDKMQKNIANALKIEKNQVNVKATTEERLGFTGREEGISSQAICALSSLYENSVMVSDSAGGCCGGCQRG